MHYTRLEMRFLPRGWSGGQLVEGAVAGSVRGVAVEIDSRQIEYTLIQPRRGGRSAELEIHRAGTARTALPDGLVRLSRDTKVRAGTSSVGWVSAIWCDRQSRSLTHVLVTPRRRLLKPAPRVVEVAHIAGMADNTVTLKLAAADVPLLPIYRTDAAIAADLRVLLEGIVPDPRTRRSIKVRVEDAHVYLAGVVDAAEVKQRAEAAAARVSGVRGVTSDIIIDESLAALVVAALAPALSLLPDAGAAVRVFTEHGIVYLEGTVPDAASRAALERTAVGAPGVRVVVNNLLVPGETPSRARDTGPLTRNR